MQADLTSVILAQHLGQSFPSCKLPAMGAPVRPSAVSVIVLRIAPLWLSGHLVVGLVEYRRTMRRPWPQVPPLADDDDW
jgi:hypothetical protein